MTTHSFGAFQEQRIYMGGCKSYNEILINTKHASLNCVKVDRTFGLIRNPLAK